MDIFEEFSERKETQAVAVSKKRTPVERIARLTARRVAEHSILQIFQLTQQELTHIRTSEAYANAMADALEANLETPLETESNWDDLESRALKVAMQGIDSVQPSEAIRIAGMANRAIRRTKDKPIIKDGSGGVNIETVNIAIPEVFAEKMLNINPVADLDRIMAAALEHKTINIAKPRKIEEMLSEEAEREEDEQTVMDIIG